MRALRNQVEKQVLHDAKLAFFRADYPDAILSLHRFVRTYPHSSRSPEARWWLARSYQGLGNLHAAAEHFRLLARAQPSNSYQAEALVRAAQLEDLMGEPTTVGPVNGILVSFASLRMLDDPESGSVDDQRIEGSTILLDIPCGLDGNVLDNGQPLSFHALDSVIRRLHLQGAVVYLGVTLRCLGNMAEDRHDTLEHWQDWAYSPSSDSQATTTSGLLRRSSYYSLEFWGYREFLVDWLSQLRDLPLTGLVFRAEAPSGVHEGFSHSALKAFKREFGVSFDPVRVLDNHGPIPAAGFDGEAQLPDVFWKWAGWKARERLRILREMVDTLRVRLPLLRFGLEVQHRSIADPTHGLVHFAEDWADMARSPFDVFLTTINEDESPALPHSTSQGLPATRGSSVGSPEGSGPVFQMVQHVGKPEKIWAILPRRALQTLSQPWMVPEGVGRVYDYRVAP